MDQIFEGKWRLTDESKLENESKDKWKYEELTWILPKEGTEGCIEDQTSGKVLAFQENEVILEDKEDPISNKQKWNRGISDENGWFLLGKPLTCTPSSKYYLLVCQRLWNFMVWWVKFNRHLYSNKSSSLLFTR